MFPYFDIYIFLYLFSCTNRQKNPTLFVLHSVSLTFINQKGDIGGSKMEIFAMVMRGSNDSDTRKEATENTRAVAEMRIEGRGPRGRPRLRWRDTVRGVMKAWTIREEWAQLPKTTVKDEKVLEKKCYWIQYSY